LTNPEFSATQVGVFIGQIKYCLPGRSVTCYQHDPQLR
jgi:hypothetical protein